MNACNSIIHFFLIIFQKLDFDNLIRQPYRTEPISDTDSRLVDPISVRSNTPRSPHGQRPDERPSSVRTNTYRDGSSPRKQTASDRQISIKITTPRDPFSPRKQITHEGPLSIKTTTPREPFSARKPVTHSTYSTAGTPRQAASPTIADRHREARQRLLQKLSRERDEDALHLADALLHGEPIPPSRALEEFQLEPLETSFTSTVRELAGPDGLVNRTYDLDLIDMDDDYDLDDIYSERIPSRPMSATTTNYNNNATQYSTSSSAPPRPSSASSTRSSRRMTSMGKAIIQV